MSGFENVMELQNENEGMGISSMSVAKPSGIANPFLASYDWDPLVSMSQVQTFGGSSMVSHSEFDNSSYPLVLENQGMSSTSHHFVHYIADSYGSGSFLEMVDVANTGYHPNYNPTNEGGMEKGPINNEQSQGPGEVEPGSAPNENRRKRRLDYNSTLNKSGEEDEMKDSCGKNSNGVIEQDEKKHKVEQSTSAHLGGKQSVKQNKDNSHNGEAPNESFVHLRAGRGKATNSHSLAERVRREKISDRMRFLQELVPGCNKITGKAVMLDEIINYVLSLQQQVEFLSMKLATVNPELNFDVIERILSKDPCIGHRPIGEYGLTINCSCPFPSGSSQGTPLPAMPSTSTQFPPLPKIVLDHEFQSLYGMSYNSTNVLDNLAPNGRDRLKNK